MGSSNLRHALRFLVVVTGMLFLAVGSLTANPERQLRLVVSQDGLGTHRTIQDAIDAVPEGHTETALIIVRKGTYREKLFITKSRIAIVGDDRDSTRIVVPELRRNWRAAHADSDWGCAVVNIGGTATDVTLANMTIHNNYGALTGDHDHQFAIFATERATKISLLDCTVIADGGDTVSLWNTVDGMYYHNGCRFVGWVDYVCPRGWCYITDSEFFGYNLSASLWHDGSADRDQKFVITHSRFDGVAGFPLGRHHRDGQFYLLDCQFSGNMADRPIYNPTDSPNSRPWTWGDRHYYDGCDRAGEDFGWFADNLSTAPGSPRRNDITPAWTFGGKWDPPAQLPAILPAAAIPQPEDHSKDAVIAGMTLRWTPGRDATGHIVRFGTRGAPPVVSTVEAPTYATGPLKAETIYYWSIDTITPTDTLRGPVWQFHTSAR